MRVLFVCLRELARNPINHGNPWIEDYRRAKLVNRTNSADLSHQFMRYDSSVASSDCAIRHNSEFEI